MAIRVVGRQAAASGTTQVKSSVSSNVPGIKLSITGPKNIHRENLDMTFENAFEIKLTAKGGKASQGGTIAVQYGDQNVRINVRRGARHETIVTTLLDKLMNKEGGSINSDAGTFQNSNKNEQTVFFVVTNYN